MHEKYVLNQAKVIEMNQKDLIILRLLRTNARMSLTKISRRTNIPVSTIFDRLKFHERNLIKKHTCLLDFAKLGYNTTAKIVLRVEREDRQPLKEFLMKHTSVNSVYKITNGFDFMVEGIFRQVSDLEEFVEQLETKFKIQDKKYFFILEEIKREAFLSGS